MSTHNPYISAATEQIAIALSMKRLVGKNWQGDCPVCNYPGAFSLAERNSVTLYFCHACQDSELITEFLYANGLMENRTFTPAVSRLKAAKEGFVVTDDLKRQQFVRRIWATSIPIGGTLAATYLANRQIKGDLPDTLRYHPVCYHRESDKYHPAMVAGVRVWPNPEIVAVHRTFLMSDGSNKIEHQPARLSLGIMRGGSVQLAVPDKKLAIAEGIETSLSVQMSTGIPTWACLSTSGLRSFIAPEMVEEIVICADHDGPGMRAAEDAAERLTRQKKRVNISVPPIPGDDFNDVLKKG